MITAPDVLTKKRVEQNVSVRGGTLSAQESHPVFNVVLIFSVVSAQTPQCQLIFSLSTLTTFFQTNRYVIASALQSRLFQMSAAARCHGNKTKWPLETTCK